MDIPKILIIPIIAGSLAQVLKLAIDAFRGNWRWKTLRQYGGMPSAHTAFVVSVTTMVGLHEGIQSPLFAVAVIFSLLIIRDATGLRQFLSQHGRILNKLIHQLPLTEEQKFTERVVEQLGHTPFQAIVGGLIGLATALLLNLWIPARW